VQRDIKDYEDILRESGFSRSSATIFVGGLKRLFRDEPDEPTQDEISPEELKFAIQTILLRS